MIFKCIGKRSKKPYLIRDTQTGIYSLEELLYYIRENVFMLNPADFDKSLARFLDKNLGLPETAEKFDKLLSSNASFADRICLLFSDTGFASEAETETLRKALTMSEHMSNNDSHRVRGDFFFKSERIAEAVIEYDAALSIIDREKDGRGAARLLSGLGNAAAKMFKFDKALKYYEEAYSLDPGDPEILNKLIVSARLSIKNDGFLQYMTEKNIPEDIYEKVLLRLNETEKKAMRKNDERSLREIRKLKADGNYAAYVTERHRLLNDWKNRYRNTGG